MPTIITTFVKSCFSKITPQLSVGKFSTLVPFYRYNNITNEIGKLSPKNTWEDSIQAFKASIAIQSYLFSKEISSHLTLKNIPGISFKGKAIIRDEPQEQGGKPSLRIAEQEEIDLATTFAIGGIGGDDPKQVSALLKYAKLLAAKYPNSKDYLPLTIFPEVNQKERYKDAVEYTLNSDYYPPYIKERVERFLLPRVLKNLGSEEISKLSLFSFSMGGREVMMMQKALRDILEQQFYLPKIIIDNLMSDITAVCVGYAPNVNAFEDTGFKKIVLFSLDDRGVLIPHDLYESVLSKENLLTKNFNIYQMNKSFEAFQYLVVNGKGVIKSCETDCVDHTISHYFDCIEKMPEDIIDLIGKSINPPDEL